VVVLDLETGRPLRPPVAAHDAALLSLAYSSDGKQLLTSAADASTALWDAETGRLVARVVTPSFLSIAQFADGRSVVVADAFVGAVYRWDTRPEYAVEFACRLAGRDFTEEEWAEQFGDRPYQHVCPQPDT
jgi:WD40 repeat protein